jgi:hypothetical protein
MGNLLSLNPKIHSLGTDTKILGSLPNSQRKFVRSWRARLIEISESIAIHVTCPWSSKFASPWKKGTARLFVPEGGSDPTKLLGGLAAKKRGRSRPFQSFFHGDLSFHCRLYHLRIEEIARATG